jgi:6-phosphogluconolactonase
MRDEGTTYLNSTPTSKQLGDAVGARIVYVSCSDPARIHIFEMDHATGALTARDLIDIPGMGPGSGGPATPLALSPDQTRLYAHVRVPPFPISTYAIDRNTGALRLLGVAQLPDQCAYINTDRTGRYLLVSSYQGGMVAIQPIGSDGVVRETATQVISTPVGSHSIMPDPTNRFVYVGNITSSSILRFAFDAAAGLLHPLKPVAAKPHAEPRHVRFAPSGRFLYVINEGDATINAYAFDAVSGELLELQTISIVADGAEVEGSKFAAEIQITPDGRFMYGSVRSTNTLMALQIDADTGMMSPIGSTPSETWPRNFAIDPTGRFLLCGGQHADTVSIHAIDAETGLLTRVGVREVKGRPNWIEFLR